MNRRMRVSDASRPDDGWRRGFRLFWGAIGASSGGDQLREFTLPLLAITVLHASSFELGMVAAAQWVPFLVLALPFGVLIDRHRRRRMLVLSDAGRALTMTLLVAAVLIGFVSVPFLVVLAIALGVFAVVFEVGYQSVIPALVPRRALEGSNARVQATVAAAEVGGPGVGGVIVQAFGMPAALLASTLGYASSGLAVSLIRADEPVPPRENRNFVAELRDGARHVLQDPYLRANVGFSAIYNPFAQWVMLLLTVHAVRELGLDALQLGLVFTVGAVGALVGAAATSRLTARLTIGQVLMLCVTVECLVLLVLPLASASWHPATVVAFLGAALAVNGAGTAVSNVVLITIRQLRTPDRLLGRVNATMRTVT
ncbi:MAG: transporter [Microbacterium sp.]|jgi:MFS family permease|nr:transporter [Microbacterium sp.]